MIFDFDLNFLKAAADLVDAKLEYLDGQARESPDPDSFGIFDETEYITLWLRRVPSICHSSRT